MDPANGAHSEDFTYWYDEEIRNITDNTFPPLDIDTHGDSSKGNHQLAIRPPPPPSSSSSSSGSRDEKQDYMPFSSPEIEMLIEGVHKHGCNWKEIMHRYFKKSGRTANRLKEKWIHMLKSANNERNHPYKELYLKAKNVDALYPKRYSYLHRSSVDCE